MKIGVLSDTHIKAPDKVLNHILDDIFKDVNMILHAGDIVTSGVLDRLEERNVLAVCGNMDDYVIIETLPQIRTISAGTKRIASHTWVGLQTGPARKDLNQV